MTSDIVPGEDARIVASGDGRWVTFLAPRAGSMELFRIATEDGALEQLTSGHHYVSSFDSVDRGHGRSRTAWLRSSPTELSDLWMRDGPSGAPRRLTDLNHDALAEVDGVAGLLGGHFGSRDRRTDPERAAKAVHVDVAPGGTVGLAVHVVVAYGASIPDVAAAAAESVRRYLRSMVDLEVEAVTLHVDAVAG